MLKGSEIPISARITAIVDVYDALRSKRPYKEPWSHEKTIELITDQSGLHFDPSIANAFLVISDHIEKIYNELK